MTIFRYVLYGLGVLLLAACASATDSQNTSTGGTLRPIDPEDNMVVTATAVRPAATTTAQTRDETATLYLPIISRTGQVIAVVVPTPTEVPTVILPTATDAPPTTATSMPTATSAEPAATPDTGTTPVETMNLRGDLPAMTLTDWERPIDDNGRCMHWTRNQYFTETDLNTNIPRLQQLNAKWVVVVYADENIIKMAAPRFKEAGIIPIWRKMLRPFQRYYDWKRDVDLVKSYGLPPYFQIYNEPDIGQEWTDEWDGPADEVLFIDNLMQASEEVYNAGGYVGWQFINLEWMNHSIDEVQRRNGTKIFERFFFVPHPYGENLPPDWTEDGRGVLSWRKYVDVFQSRLGITPPMIAGEGGWRINGQDESRFPPMDEATHARYHVELFDWFRTGIVSDGQPLPDYFFAYCVWLIAEKGDDNAWWDSFAGDRNQTIQAVSSMPPFTRKLP